ncbi:MAG: FHA domain-containing protein [Anaerolineae bacterium]|nr:FHA domain-containing protein [Anaerolineae bacterium]
MGIVCRHCDHLNRSGALVCDRCHQSLVEHATGSVVNTDWLVDARRTMTSEVVEAQQPAKAELCEVILRVAGAPQPLVLELANGGLILGRTDLEGRVFPDVDLSPFSADAHGVSRRHARLTVNTATREVEIVDLGSLNGTYINGERLEAHKARYLNSGDEVRLSRLRFIFFYRT